MSIVVDASIVLAFHFEDESSVTADRVFEMLLSHEALVPVHWHAEVANGFAIAVRRNRMTREFRTGALNRLGGLRFVVDETSRSALWSDTIEICDRHALTAYDAAYLELALRKHLPLATLDKSLASAAVAEGADVFNG